MQPFITTFTGKKVNPLNLRPEDIDIRDIAHHLACINRFCGALRFPVSVAQHCVYVSRLVQGTGWEMQALLHDASEAYLGDVTKWLKGSPAMAAFREAEDRAERLIYDVFGCAPTMGTPVEEADRLMVRFETLQGLATPHLFQMGDPRYAMPTKEERNRVGKWMPWPWRAAEEAFLSRFRVLTNGVEAAFPVPEEQRGLV
jgi:hypothetical protein